MPVIRSATASAAKIQPIGTTYTAAQLDSCPVYANSALTPSLPWHQLKCLVGRFDGQLLRGHDRTYMGRQCSVEIHRDGAVSLLAAPYEAYTHRSTGSSSPSVTRTSYARGAQDHGIAWSSSNPPPSQGGSDRVTLNAYHSTHYIVAGWRIEARFTSPRGVFTCYTDLPDPAPLPSLPPWTRSQLTQCPVDSFEPLSLDRINCLSGRHVWLSMNPEDGSTEPQRSCMFAYDGRGTWYAEIGGVRYTHLMAHEDSLNQGPERWTSYWRVTDAAPDALHRQLYSAHRSGVMLVSLLSLTLTQPTDGAHMVVDLAATDAFPHPGHHCRGLVLH